jgi:hypothetical protein
MFTVGQIQARAPDLALLVPVAIQRLDLAAGSKRFNPCTRGLILDVRHLN